MAKKFHLHVVTKPYDISTIVTINSIQTNTALIEYGTTVYVTAKLNGFKTYNDSFLMPKKDSVLIINLIQNGESIYYHNGDNVTIEDSTISVYGLNIDKLEASTWISSYGKYGYTIPINRSNTLIGKTLYDSLAGTTGKEIISYSYNNTLSIYDDVLNNELIAINKNYVDKSLDGLTWYSNSYSSLNLIKAASSQDSLVVISNSNKLLYASKENMFNFVTIEVQNINNFNDIAFDDSNFIILTSNNKLAISNNKSKLNITFSIINIPEGNWSNIKYNNGIYIILSKEDNKVLYSADLITFNEINLPIRENWNGLDCSNNIFFIFGNDKILYSENGLDWNLSRVPKVQSSIQCITYGDNKYVCLESDFVHFSDDLLDWQVVRLPDLGNSYIWSNIKYYNNMFIAVNITSNDFVYSNNGINFNAGKTSKRGYTDLIQGYLYEIELVTYNLVDADSQIFENIPKDYDYLLLSASSVFNIAGNRSTKLGDLKDVELTNIQPNQILVYEDNKWVNKDQLVNSTFVYEQGVVSDEWYINHNLNKRPSVTVVDTADSVVTPDIKYVDNNNLIVKTKYPFKGKAYLN